VIWDRFWAKVRADPATGCWVWQAGCFCDGYGNFWCCGSAHRAHRFAYRQLVGPIPSWLQIDHLCRNRACVNPAHMELVTCRENLSRGVGIGLGAVRFQTSKTHCPQGHPYDEQNTYIYPTGARGCRACNRIHSRERRRNAKTRS